MCQYDDMACLYYTCNCCLTNCKSKCVLSLADIKEMNEMVTTYPTVGPSVDKCAGLATKRGMLRDTHCDKQQPEDYQQYNGAGGKTWAVKHGTVKQGVSKTRVSKTG